MPQLANKTKGSFRPTVPFEAALNLTYSMAALVIILED